MKDNCKLQIDNSYIRKNFTRIAKYENKETDSLITTYENSFVLNPEFLNEYKNEGNLYSLSIPEIQNPEWHFILKREKSRNAKLFIASMYLITKNHPTINNIIEVTNIFDNNELPYTLSTCISDSELVTTKIIKFGYDVVINDISTHKYDSLVSFYSISDQNLLLKEERNFKKYIYY